MVPRQRCHDAWCRLARNSGEGTIDNVGMENNDLTTEILKDIRDAVRGTNDRIDQTNARLDQTNARLDQTNARIEEQTNRVNGRLSESEIRTATAVNQLRGTMEDVKELLQTRLDVRDRLERCEREIEVIKVRIAG